MRFGRRWSSFISSSNSNARSQSREVSQAFRGIRNEQEKNIKSHHMILLGSLRSLYIIAHYIFISLTSIIPIIYTQTMRYFFVAQMRRYVSPSFSGGEIQPNYSHSKRWIQGNAKLHGFVFSSCPKWPSPMRKENSLMLQREKKGLEEFHKHTYYPN